MALTAISLVFSSLLTSCSSSEVQLAPRYQPGVLADYTLDTFKAEWSKTEGQDVQELMVLQDLISKRGAKFDWGGFWSGFASGEYALPTTDRSLQLMLSERFEKCSGNARDGFIDFATHDFSPARDFDWSLKLIDSALALKCQTPTNEKSWKRIRDRLASGLLRFDKIKGSENRRLAISLLAQTLDQARKDKVVDDMLDPRATWVSLMTSLFKEEGRSLEYMDLLESVNRSESLQTRTLRQDLSIVDEALMAQGTWNAAQMNRLGERLSPEAILKIVRRTRGLKEFASLSATEQDDFLLGIFNIVTRISGAERAASWLSLLDYLDQLSDLNLRAKWIDQLDRETIRWIDTLDLASVEQVKQKFAKEVRWSGWRAFFETQTQDATTVSISQGPRATFSSKSEASELDRLMMLRAEVRMSLNQPRTYRIAIKNYCDEIRSYFGLSSTPELATSGGFESLQNQRGCRVITTNESSIRFKNDTHQTLPVDLLLFTRGKSFMLDSSAPVDFLFVDVSPDTLDSFPEVPKPLEPAASDSAIGFTVIMGVEYAPKAYEFIPFHFIARQPKRPSDPDRNIELRERFPVKPIALSGQILINAERSSIRSAVLVSNGAFGIAGIPPEIAGAGDISYPHKDSNLDVKELAKKREDLYSHNIRFIDQPTNADWIQYIELARRLERVRTDRFNIVDHELMLLLLDPEDRVQYEAYLESIVANANPDEVAAYCARIKSDAQYEALVNTDGRLDGARCTRVYALEQLGRQAYFQAADLVLHRDFSDQLSQEVPITIKGGGIGRPGTAVPGGIGGEITVRARNAMGSMAAALGGDRFIWPSAWNASDRDGRPGLDGQIKWEINK